MKTIHIAYYALLREERGTKEETLTTTANTVKDLYIELKEAYHFRLSEMSLKTSVNDTLCGWETVLKNGDHVVFIPPVSGG